MFCIGPNIVTVTVRTVANFRYLQEMSNDIVHTVFECSNKIVIDESISGWHGRDEKRVDGPPALTHMIRSLNQFLVCLRILPTMMPALFFQLKCRKEKNR